MTVIICSDAAHMMAKHRWLVDVLRCCLPYTQVVPPGCPTTSWQPASGVKGGPPLVLFTNNGTSSNNASQPHLGFCQSSQPNWSAFRDPR